MEISKSQASKIAKKQRRCQLIIKSDTGIECGDVVSENIAICNAGLSTGLKAEDILRSVEGIADVQDVVMVPGKSFCFLKTRALADSERLFEALHGKTRLAQNDGCLYLSYCDRVPEVESSWDGELPPGLIIIEDFITPEEEGEYAGCVVWSDDDQNLKHRQVKHFGYKFLYGKNNIDTDHPLPDGIPGICNKLWDKLHQKRPELGRVAPDQLTMNKYETGQGIPAHVDTHSAFTGEIISLSLCGDIVMEFRNAKRSRSVFVKRRSLLIMTGESRYDWTHAITPRKHDIVPIGRESTKLTCRERGQRISFTFRTLRRSKQCDCTFPTLCDTFKANQEKSFDITTMASAIELSNVHEVYDKIGGHFSETRHSPWPQVLTFLDSFPGGSVLLDVGCGNGKYLMNANDKLIIGCDRSQTLLQVCQERQLNVFQCDCLSLPMRDESMDGCFSIAVIHHLATKERRLRAIKEMHRVLAPGGRALIYVWSKNQEADKSKSSYLKQHRKKEDDIIDDIKSDLPLPVHKNRTQFQHQDVLVPWKLKGEQVKTETLLRYYHVFEQYELKHLCEEIEGVDVLREYYDQGNWCVEFIKRNVQEDT